MLLMICVLIVLIALTIFIVGRFQTPGTESAASEATEVDMEWMRTDSTPIADASSPYLGIDGE